MAKGPDKTLALQLFAVIDARYPRPKPIQIDDILFALSCIVVELLAPLAPQERMDLFNETVESVLAGLTTNSDEDILRAA